MATTPRRVRNTALYGLLIPGSTGLRRRPHGQPYSRISREEDRGLRDEDGVPRHPHPPLLVLGGAAIACVTGSRPEGRRQSTPAHGFSEILTRSRNNGSAFGGLSAEIPLLQRGAGHLHVVRATGSSSRCSRSPDRSPRSPIVPQTSGTLPTHNPLFVPDAPSAPFVVVGASTFIRRGARATSSTSSRKGRVMAVTSTRSSRPATRSAAGRSPLSREQWARRFTPRSADRAHPQTLRGGHREERARRGVQEARPAAPVQNPVMFVVEVGSAFTTVLFLQSPWRTRRSAAGWFLILAIRSGSGSPSSLRTSRRRWRRAAARRRRDAPTEARKPRHAREEAREARLDAKREVVGGDATKGRRRVLIEGL